jgi:lipid-binding SYLF domain-containing protein
MSKTSNGMLLVLVAVIALTTGGCKSPSGSTNAQKRDSVLQMRDDALPRFYAAYPGLRQQVEAAPGYAVFSDFGLKILVAGSDHGYGVLHNNKTSKDTYMRMAGLNVGLGFELSNFRSLFVFNDPQTLKKFEDDGWDFNGEAEASAKFKHDGAGVGAAGSVNDMDIYQITKSGVALAAAVGGTKYWWDDKLNMPDRTELAQGE